MKNTSQKVLSIVVLLWILFYLSIALLGQAALEGKIGINLLYAATITALTGLLLIKGFQYLVEKIDQSRGTIVFIVILSVLVVVPRYILNVNFSVLQESDYEKYLTISQYMFLGERIPDNELLYIKEWASNQFIIEKIFSFSYYIWGNIGQQAPLYLNIWFTLGYVLLFYMVCKDLLNKSIAFIAAATLAVWPENVMNSIYLLSEPMYMFFLFAGIAFCWYGVKYSRSWLWLLGGGLLRISQEIRATTIVFLLSIIIIYMILCNDKHKARKLFCLILGYLGVGMLYSIYLYSQIGEVAAPAIGWPIYLGSCIDNWGSWSAASALSAQEAVKDSSLSEMQNILLEKAIENYQSYDLKTILYLLIRKAQTILGFGDATIRDVKYLMEMRPEAISGSLPSAIWAWCSLANWVYVITAIGALGTAIYNLTVTFKYKVTDLKIIAMMLPICGIMAMHCFIYVSPRYIYPTIPFFVAIFFYSIYQLSGIRRIVKNVL